MFRYSNKPNLQNSLGQPPSPTPPPATYSTMYYGKVNNEDTSSIHYIVVSTEICETGWQFFKGYCYYFNPQDVVKPSFTGAQNECQSMGAQLASIHDEDENEFIRGNCQKERHVMCARQSPWQW